MAKDYSPELDHLLKLFNERDLPSRLRKTSEYFRSLAVLLATEQPDGEELRVALRHLLAARDAAVRHVRLTSPWSWSPTADAPPRQDAPPPPPPPREKPLTWDAIWKEIERGFREARGSS
jgi:hypothetical protein